MGDIKFEYEFSLKSIKQHREEQGISQSELARRTQFRIPQGKISKLEAGFINLTSNSALCLSNALKTNILGLLLGQDMANKGISLEDRKRMVMKIAKGDSDLLRAYKSINRVKGLNLDFGNRDSFGRRLHPKEILARKRAEKRAEKRRKDLDFGDRDSFGRKRIAKKHISAHDFDDLDLEGLDEDQKFLAKLNRIIEMGERRRKG